MNVKFYICKKCGNIVDMVQATVVTPACCGQGMVELVANTTDAATEKHVPEVKVDGNKVTVTVGSVAHPMLEEHHIAWIYIVTTQGVQRKNLTVPNAAVAEFALCDGEQLVEVYEYCNLHGLWKATV